MTNGNQRKTNHPDKELEKEIHSIFVMNNRQLKPYAELFEYHPENIYQRPLGSLMGFFEMKEYSKDSEYIVNFLTSVLKKEYYINPKRCAAESFDSALHKVNVALSEIAKHGNISWLGKIDAAVCALENNNIHFSVTGNGHLYIKRDDQFANISDGLAPSSENPHPLKTFIDVSSGHVETGDRILIFSDDIFQILPPEKLKRSILRYDRKKFSQFMKTALSNELEMTCAIILDMFEKEGSEQSNLALVQQDNLDEDVPIGEFNAFSQNTYVKKRPYQETSPSPKTPAEEEEKKEYTDKKTGHIYIQGDGINPSSETQTSLAMSMAKEKIADFTLQSKQEARRIILSMKKKLSRPRVTQTDQQVSEMKNQSEATSSSHPEITPQPEEQVILPSTSSTPKKLENTPRKKISYSQHTDQIPLKTKEIPLEKIQESREKPESSLTLQEKIRLAKQQIIETERIPLEETDEELPIKKNTAKGTGSETHTHPDHRKKVSSQAKTAENQQGYPDGSIHDYASRLSEGAGRFLNPISPEKALFKNVSDQLQPLLVKTQRFTLVVFKKITRLSSKQKIFALGVALPAVLAIVFFLQAKEPPKPEPQTESNPIQPTLQEILSSDKNMVMDTSIQKVFVGDEGISVVTFENQPYVLTKGKIVTTKDGSIKEYPIPQQEGSAIGATVMKDVGIILILTDQKKILSFSPTSGQFKSNAINIPDGFQPKFMATYMTYLYMPDSQSNLIYRFPRAEGGFGEKLSWLKDGQNLPAISSMSIDDSVYFSDGMNVYKYFRGEKQSISLENSKTPISYNFIHTSTDSSFIYLLDTKNYRIIRYSKSGEIIRQYFVGNQFGNIRSFAVDAHDEKAYFTSDSELIIISL